MSVQELKPCGGGCLVILQSCWQEPGWGKSPWWFVVLEKEDQSCWTARNLISGHSCLFHLVVFPLTRQTHTFWRGCNTHCLFLPHHRNIWLGSPPVFLMLASSNTSDIKLADHPLPSFWVSVWFFPSNGTCPNAFLRRATFILTNEKPLALYDICPS